uniref:LIM/homeobox protein Lhx2-like n=1 Tax=Myxine glutinosa TaxID=7769 RepID=UPI00358ED351
MDVPGARSVHAEAGLAACWQSSHGGPGGLPAAREPEPVGRLKREEGSDADAAGDPGPPPCAPCAGCGRRIAERFYLLALGRQWHLRCLKCCECELALDTELSCYARDGSIYCRDDYYRRFSAQRCAGCQLGISASELVMRARDLVFHLRCFSCAACRRPLTPGEHFGMRGALVYCRPHFEGLLQAEEASARDDNPAATTLGAPEGLRGAWVEAGEEVLRSAQAAGRGRAGPQKPRPRKRKSVGPHAGDMLDYSSSTCHVRTQGVL